MNHIEGLVETYAARARSHVQGEGDLEKNLRGILDAIDHASSGGKTYIIFPESRVSSDTIPLLKKHFYVHPIGRYIGASVFSTSHSEEKYIRIGWGSFDVASMETK